MLVSWAAVELAPWHCLSSTGMQYSGFHTVCDMQSTDLNNARDGWKWDCTTRNPLCCKTPFERTLRELHCLCSVQDPSLLVSLFVLHAVQADLRWAIDKRKQRWRRRRLREQLMGAFLRENVSEEGHLWSVQDVQVCCEMRWPRPSHDSWLRHDAKVSFTNKAFYL